MVRFSHKISMTSVVRLKIWLHAKEFGYIYIFPAAADQSSCKWECFCFKDKQNLSDWNSCPLRACSLKAVALHKAETHLKPVPKSKPRGEIPSYRWSQFPIIWHFKVCFPYSNSCNSWQKTINCPVFLNGLQMHIIRKHKTHQSRTTFDMWLVLLMLTLTLQIFDKVVKSRTRYRIRQLLSFRRPQPPVKRFFPVSWWKYWA